jgi:8-oxo-dGTP pyrophosphatase MutT (NUDIX family)
MATNHFSAGYIFKKIDDIWYVLSIKDKRFNEPKAAGGMSEVGEDPIATLRRELRQELGVDVINAVLVHEVGKQNHTQYFFLITEVSGLPAIDEKRELREIKAGVPGDVLDMSWVTLDEFSKKVYKGQREAFSKAVIKKAEDDRVFCMDNLNLL